MRRFRLTLIIILTTFLMVAFKCQPTHIQSVSAQGVLHAARVLNATEIHAGQSIQIYTIINNPETWTLYNISGHFLIRPATKLTIVDALNITNVSVTRYVFEREEYVNVTFEIKYVAPQTTFIHWVVIRFGEEGTYSIVSSKISGVRVKGELKEEFELGINDASIEVKKYVPGYPPEGTKDGTLLAVFITILLPLIFMGGINKLIKEV